jgi:hypothetical protein
MGNLKQLQFESSATELNKIIKKRGSAGVTSEKIGGEQ